MIFPVYCGSAGFPCRLTPYPSGYFDVAIPIPSTFTEELATFDTVPPPNQDNDLSPINLLISHLPIPGTFPVSVYCQISHGYAGLGPP